MDKAIINAGIKSLGDAKKRANQKKMNERVENCIIRDNFKYFRDLINGAKLSSTDYLNKYNDAIITRFLKNGEPVPVLIGGETHFVVLKLRSGGDYLSIISDAEYLELTSLK